MPIPRGRYKDLTNHIFGRLRVLCRSGTLKGNVVWKCLCLCGNQVDVKSERLIAGKTSSCGCLKRDLSRERMSKLHQGNIKPGAAKYRVLSEYKGRSKRKNLEFLFTDSEFYDMVSTKCFYCGAEPSNLSTAWSGEEFKYNGLDQVNSGSGYVPENCVPACRQCNWMKSKYSQEDFFRQVRKIYNYQKGEE